MTVGYGPSNDAQYNSSHGYRSGKLADVGAGTSIGATNLEYNGFVFPPTSRITATVVQEYDDPRRTVKFLTLAITVEAIITSVNATPTATYADTNTDSIMDSIRNRLSQPGQPLKIVSQGLGHLRINTGLFDQTHKDVEFGPKTQVIEIKPIAGQAAMQIVWLVTTRIAACSNVTGSGLTQAHHSISWHTNYEGITTRTIKGKIEQSQSRTPNIATSKAQQNIPFPLELLTELTNTINKYPPIGGYKRDVSYELSPGRNILTFTISDTEYPTNQPLFPETVEVRATESLNGDFLEKGFHMWDYRISGTIKVPKPGLETLSSSSNINDLKKQALLWLGLFIVEKLKRAKIYTAEVLFKLDFDSVFGEDGSPSTVTLRTIEKDVVHIPVSISISDELFGNTFSFSFRWNLKCAVDIVLLATGFFDTMNVSGNTWETHRKRLNDLSVSHQQGLPTPINRIPADYVIDLCNQSVKESTPPESLPTPRSDFNYAYLISVPNQSNSFLDYKNYFDLEQITETVYGVRLSEEAPVQEPPKTDPVPPTKFDPANQSSQSGTSSNKNLAIINPSSTQYTITMRGSAIRVGFGIDAPNLVSYGGQAAYKTGEKVREQVLQVSPVVKNENNNDVSPSIYRLDWEKTYILAGKPANSNKATDAIPERYA